MKNNFQPVVSCSSQLRDEFARTISYLRLSVTDRCNLCCRYCQSDGQHPELFNKLPHSQLFSYEELLRVVRVAVGMGVNKLRLTGGEPLVRRNLIYFINRLSEIEALKDIRLTTNGVLLAGYAERLLQAGVTAINISLDTLRPERFIRITGRDRFAEVWRGIEHALAVGFSAVKINMVVIRHVNDDELQDFARLSGEYGLQVRFIEYMPVGPAAGWEPDAFVPAGEMMERLVSLGSLEPVISKAGEGPARIYRIKGNARGSIGFITPLSNHFCGQCNRLRLTADGRLRPCLLHDQSIDLKKIVRGRGSDEDIRRALLSAVRLKPAGHAITPDGANRGPCSSGLMSRIGG